MGPATAAASAADGINLPLFNDFAQAAQAELYVALPGDWLVGAADVVGSTEAIAAGRYKTVNVVGAAVIAALMNAAKAEDILFVFGGDGASFAVPPRLEQVARVALAATAAWVRDEFDLTLRIAMATVADIRAAGFDVRAARFAPSPDVAYAMFAGGGVSWLSDEMKRGGLAIEPAPAGTKPDLSGLSCRFEEMAAKRGLILSLIVVPRAAADPVAFRAAVEDVLSLIEKSPEAARPIGESGPPVKWLGGRMDLEARVARQPGGSLAISWLRSLGRSLVAAAALKKTWRFGAFDPDRYIGQLVANSDYRKFDDGLRMTIDCSRSLADAIEARLESARSAGLVEFGLHRQAASIMTCITPSIYTANHVHFVDGASGGYASAAARLKPSAAM